MSLIKTFKLKRHVINHLAGLTMTEQFCTAKLHEFEQFVLQKRDSMLALLCFTPGVFSCGHSWKSRGFSPSFIAASPFACSNVAKKNKRLLAV